MRSDQLKHLVFAYGTLKRGEPNFKWLTEEAQGNFKVLAGGKSSKKRALVIGSRYNVPYLLDYSGIFNLNSSEYSVNITISFDFIITSDRKVSRII